MIDSGACGYGFRSNRWKKNWWSCARERDLLIEQWEDWLPAFAKAMRALSLRIRMLQQQRLQSNCFGDCTTDVLRSFESACASWDLLQQLQIIIIIIVAARPRREEEVQKRNLSELELSTKAFLMRWQGFIMAWLPRSELGMDCLQTCQLQVLFWVGKISVRCKGFLDLQTVLKALSKPICWEVSAIGFVATSTEILSTSSQESQEFEES